jgi:hypothetical protein
VEVALVGSFQSSILDIYLRVNGSATALWLQLTRILFELHATKKQKLDLWLSLPWVG